MTGHIILLLGGVQGIILSAIVYSRRIKQSANFYLSAFVLLLGIGSIVDNSYLPISEKVFVVIWSGNSFLFAPLLFLYIRRLLKNFKFDWNTFLVHFSTFIVMKTTVLVYFYSNLLDEQWSIVMGVSLNLFLALFNVAYGVLILKTLAEQKKSLNPKQLVWSRAMTIFFISYTGLLLVRRILTELLSWELTFMDDYIYLGITFGIYWASYTIINQPDVITLKEKKYAKSGLSPSDIKRIGQEIMTYLTSSRVFIQSEFNFASLSGKIDIPKHQLSQVIGEYFGQSFYELITEFRINEVKRKLASGKYKHLSILGIALECGFQSKSAFNKAFRKITNQTPSQYLRSL